MPEYETKGNFATKTVVCKVDVFCKSMHGPSAGQEFNIGEAEARIDIQLWKVDGTLEYVKPNSGTNTYTTSGNTPDDSITVKSGLHVAGNQAIRMKFSAVTPPPFTSNGAVFGKVALIQLANINYLAQVNGFLPTPNPLNNGTRYDLDNYYPYPNEDQTTQGIMVADGYIHQTSDSPAVSYKIGNLVTIEGTVKFEDYVLFTAPGNDSRPVPLLFATWKWDYNVYRELPEGWIQQFNQITSTPTSTLTTFPEWSKTFVNIAP
jgi:hypothetical protein